MGDGSCDLECVTKAPPKPKIHEFIGTVKILLVDVSPSEYMWKRIDAALITLAYFMMGATVMNVLFYTLTFKLPLFMNLHIVLCTCGYQLCIACGMLLLTSLSGSSSVVKLQDRKIEHLVLQLFGLTLGLSGTALAFLTDMTYSLDLTRIMNISIHSVCGLTAGSCGILAMLLGPLLIFIRKTWIIYIKRVHMLFAMLCLIASSMAMISGIHRHCIYFWLPVKHMAHFLYLFCFLYTAIIVKTVSRSMINKYDEEN